MSFVDFSDPELVYRAYAHQKRGLDAEPYWQELERRFPDADRLEIWERCCPHSEPWAPESPPIASAERVA